MSTEKSKQIETRLEVGKDFNLSIGKRHLVSVYFSRFSFFRFLFLLLENPENILRHVLPNFTLYL